MAFDDVIMLTLDGECYCPDCLDEDEHNPDIGVCFECDESVVGCTCDTCGSCYVAGSGWTSREDATNPAYTRWTRCPSCNAQRPYDKASFDYRDARRASLRGTLRCHCCGSHTRF